MFLKSAKRLQENNQWRFVPPAGGIFHPINWIKQE
jgi:hypothetical protein